MVTKELMTILELQPFFGECYRFSNFSLQLIRGLRAFSSFLSPATRFELVLDGVINRVCVVALETGILDDATCERKVSSAYPF